MTIKERFVSALLRIYPSHWRSEYGTELLDLLLTRPLTTSVAVDVVWNGARQRATSLELSTVMGVMAMLVIVVGFVQNITAPLPYVGGAVTSLLQPSMLTLPTLVVAPLKSNLYVLALVGCGCGTYLRSRGASSPGLAAMKVTLIAGLPVMVAAILMLTGVLGIAVIGPADSPTTFQQHGFTFTFYSTDRIVPSAWSVLVSPFFGLPWSGLWGTVGGRIALQIARRQPAA